MIAEALPLALAFMPLEPAGGKVFGWFGHTCDADFVPHPIIRDDWRYMTLEPGPGPGPAGAA